MNRVTAVRLNETTEEPLRNTFREEQIYKCCALCGVQGGHVVNYTDRMLCEILPVLRHAAVALWKRTDLPAHYRLRLFQLTKSRLDGIDPQDLSTNRNRRVLAHAKTKAAALLKVAIE